MDAKTHHYPEHRKRTHLEGGSSRKGGPVGSVMFYAPVVIIAAAEFALMEDIGLGVILYAVVIGCFAVAVGFLHWRAACDPEGAGEFHGLADMLSAVMIVPLIRVFDFSLPLVFFRQAYWSMIVSLPLLVAVACLARAVGLGMRDVGLVWDGVLLQFAVGLTGIVFGFGEYALIHPQPMISEFSLGAVIVPAIVLVVFTGLTEELLFRGVIQTLAVRSYGALQGMAFSSAIFTVLHVGFNSVPHLFSYLQCPCFLGRFIRGPGALQGLWQRMG